MYKGPDLTSTLLDVLIIFRQHPVALEGDIEAMFHQVKVDPEHCKYLSFLWWKNGDTSQEPDVYQIKVHLFGARSSPLCANHALRQTAELYCRADEDEIVKSIYHSIQFVRRRCSNFNPR